MNTTTARYFTSDKFTPPALLRRTSKQDEAYVDGTWRPTKSIVDYLFGNDDNVTEISASEAQKFAPAAFT